MNEELQHQIAEMLKDGSTLVTGIVDKIVTECPDLYQQFIISKVILNTIPIFCLCVSIVLLYFAWRKKALDYYHSIDPISDGTIWLFPASSILLTVGFGIASIFNLYYLLLILFAPKIYLIKEFSSLF